MGHQRSAGLGSQCTAHVQGTDGRRGVGYQVRAATDLGGDQGDIGCRNRCVAIHHQVRSVKPGTCFGSQITSHRYLTEGGIRLRSQHRVAVDRAGLNQQAVTRRRNQVGAHLQLIDGGAASAVQRGFAADGCRAEHQVSTRRRQQVTDYVQHIDCGVASAVQTGVTTHRRAAEHQVRTGGCGEALTHFQCRDRGVGTAFQRCFSSRTHAIYVKNSLARHLQSLSPCRCRLTRQLPAIDRQRMGCVEQSKRKRIPCMEPDAAVLRCQGPDESAVGQIQVDVALGTVAIHMTD